MPAVPHQDIEPAILYLGTPVVLVSTVDAMGAVNLSPMSSAWWLGWSCMLGLDASSQTAENLRATRECVLNLPSARMAGNVDALAKTTGSVPMPPHKAALGYRHVADKFAEASLTATASIDVSPPRVAECPIQLEATLVGERPFAEGDPRMRIASVAFEVRVQRVHAAEDVLSQEYRNRVDPQRWNPLIMSFLEYFERGPVAGRSTLRSLQEEWYGGRSPERLDPVPV
jgi:flavin reductase (DIM6/NTAB) family NADH-FMN oxidoreductase RutF